MKKLWKNAIEEWLRLSSKRAINTCPHYFALPYLSKEEKNADWEYFSIEICEREFGMGRFPHRNHGICVSCCPCTVHPLDEVRGLARHLIERS